MLLRPPPRLDASGVEALLDAARRGPAAGIDCSGVRFLDPFGTLALLAVGLAAGWRRSAAWGLVLPRDPGALAWLERCGARELLERSFVIDAPDPAPPARRDEPHPALLEVAVVRSPGDVRGAVGRLKARADLLLVSRLGYAPLTADRLTVALAELLQNAVDHSGSPGLAAAHWYARGSAGVPELRIAVADVGIGVRESLAPRYRGEPGWGDAAAVRTVFREGVSRFEDPGRGLGLKAVAATVRAWGGSLRLRSGTAAGGVSPAGPANAPCDRLAPFPGTQIDIVVPHADPSAL